MVGIPLLNTSAADAYLASPYKGGLWSAPGITTDGSYIYGTTGTDTPKHASITHINLVLHLWNDRCEYSQATLL